MKANIGYRIAIVGNGVLDRGAGNARGCEVGDYDDEMLEMKFAGRGEL